jgi:hypothetical protein
MVREEVSKITSVSVVAVSLWIATPLLKDTVTTSSSNADEWMSFDPEAVPQVGELDVACFP